MERNMLVRFNVFALPLLAWAAVAGLAAHRLEGKSLACGAAPGALIEAASACGYQQPHNATLSPDRRNLVFAEVRRDRLVVLDPDTLAYKGEIGEGELRWPHDLSFAADGTLYVADSGRDRVAIFKPVPGSEEYRLTGELRGSFNNPEGVLAHPDGTVYVTGEDSGTVVAFRDGREVAKVEGLNRPHDLDATEDGGIVVVESGRDRLVRFSAALARTGETLALAPALVEPRCVKALPEGGLAVSEKETSLVRFFRRDGTLSLSLGKGEAGFGPDAFNAPEGIAADGDRLWITDTGNGRIVRIADPWRG
jgi:DNA-binding beta-propeller fold protein YncE